MKYKILARDSIESLEEKVNTHIKDGWEPIGGVSVNFSEYSNDDKIYSTYCQAMIMKNT